MKKRETAILYYDYFDVMEGWHVYLKQRKDSSATKGCSYFSWIFFILITVVLFKIVFILSDIRFWKLRKSICRKITKAWAYYSCDEEIEIAHASKSHPVPSIKEESRGFRQTRMGLE